jgi:hypothetical protein
MTTRDDKPVTLDDIDEALHWAALTAARGQHWQEWVDQLLDVRATLSPLSTLSTSQNKTKTKNVKQQSKHDNTKHKQ